MCRQCILVVACASDAAAGPANVTRTQKRTVAVCALRIPITVVVVNATLGHIRTCHARPSVSPVARARE